LVIVVVSCPLRICLISNGHLPVTFLGLFKVLLPVMQNPLRKHRTVFVKVVEGSEINNFTIHHLVQFC
jgi:hypothetical protein